jgi:hypothetical protein
VLNRQKIGCVGIQKKMNVMANEIAGFGDLKKNSLIILSELTIKCKIVKKKANEIAGFSGSNLFS